MVQTRNVAIQPAIVEPGPAVDAQSEWGNKKLTMITPTWFHMHYKQGKPYMLGAYANDAEYFMEITKVY